MAWHLKDRELEEKLNKTSHPKHTFTDELNKEMDQIPKDSLKPVLGVVVIFQRIGTGGVILENNILKFSIEELVNIPEYNPHGWNEYPKVKPPKHEPLRVEFADKIGTKAFFDDCLREYVTAKRIDSPCRYRPWED